MGHFDAGGIYAGVHEVDCLGGAGRRPRNGRQALWPLRARLAEVGSRPAAPHGGWQAWAVCPPKRHNGAKRAVQIKAVPDEVHSLLRRRAGAGMSLQEYLLGRLVKDARAPTLDEVLQRAGARAGGSVSFEASAAAIRSDRELR